jgi:putative tricarboxylic transport membrane protein
VELILKSFALIADPYVLAVIAFSALFGLFVGAMPGLTATMATALLVPITFFASRARPPLPPTPTKPMP